MEKKKEEINPTSSSTDAGDGTAAQLFQEIQKYSPDELAAESKSEEEVEHICATYTLQLLDKLSLNYASAYDLIPDLGLQGMILIWGILLIGHIRAKNYTGMLILRFLLGMFEANISPAIMMTFSMFYTRSEQPLRMCISLAFNGMATMVEALLGYGLGHGHSGSLATWQLIFLVIGLLNIVWSLVFLWLVPDSPANLRFLTHKESLVAIGGVSTNMIGIKNTHFKPSQAIEARKDPKAWALAIIGLACGVVNGGVSNFASALTRGYGNSTPPFGGLLGIRLTSLEHKWTLVGCTWLRSVANGMWFTLSKSERCLRL
ncbi:MFS general substrate transporter [Choiromyces venosus 120613-1]|uniref:MFS general substrate transporter n=1 Tax=Choiromyces venosus 120613-1 TaxID=1336337 RepID=A0A3N4J6P9_9PEZI|nr:MFS general substrate transporter [Choiromyces venosus 120613-1]